MSIIDFELHKEMQEEDSSPYIKEQIVFEGKRFETDTEKDEAIDILKKCQKRLKKTVVLDQPITCLLYTSPSPRDS